VSPRQKHPGGAALRFDISPPPAVEHIAKPHLIKGPAPADLCGPWYFATLRHVPDRPPGDSEDIGCY
jgi:hypothetical protein